MATWRNLAIGALRLASVTNIAAGLRRNAVTHADRASAARGMRPTAASSIAGSEASGATVATYRSVSSTMSCTQTVSSATGTRTQVSTMSTVDAVFRVIRTAAEPCPRPLPAVSPAFPSGVAAGSYGPAAMRAPKLFV
ncbi:hypothetical protein ACOT81_33475 [Streptomyces sp. WI04-05B]|uniref:hypothetical protein n=1 Tax=Streptomyces TaxID=1883 RepID=UPI0029A597B6|nr:MULTISPECIES: hypothetical protein [unclassified Streptomyces]MDX2541774.1 hypothetical protein [Streptomyces sp. WI04-05B]MDX2586856.1 hypothetical protein [Streptomyces sp. WI04-05A]MDX3749818.1 hypothetical protein [Streptomyces sp. AK08-02]